MIFEKCETDIPGCYELIPRKMEDERGRFVKVFHATAFREHELETGWLEEYYSVSRKGVLRGMHFQLPPHDHEKLVYCIAGAVLDVIVDLRIGSPMYGKHIRFQLAGDKANMMYIPKGCAHGFYTISDSATMMYKVSTEYAQTSDSGILWNSFNIPWPSMAPIISARDAGLMPFQSFESPFVWSP